MELLRDGQELPYYASFRRMTDRYFAEFEAGNREAIATMIDFYGGPGTFASWPTRVRAYAVETTPVNIFDWASAYSFPLSMAALAEINIPALVVCGEASPEARKADHVSREYGRGASMNAVYDMRTHCGPKPRRQARIVIDVL